MRNTNAIDEKLAAILKEDGLEEPSEGFSNRLAYAVTLQHNKKDVVSFTAAKWIGKSILFVLITFSFMFLYQLHAFASQPVLFFSIVAGVVGVWGLVAVGKKLQLERSGEDSIVLENSL